MPWDQVPYAEGLTRCEVPGGTIYRYLSGHITFAPPDPLPEVVDAPSPLLATQAEAVQLQRVGIVANHVETQGAGVATGLSVQTVPRFPTASMLDAARQWWKDTYATQLGYTQAMGVWQAMFEAASPKGVAERQNNPTMQQQTGVNRQGQS